MYMLLKFHRTDQGTNIFISFFMMKIYKNSISIHFTESSIRSSLLELVELDAEYLENRLSGFKFLVLNKCQMFSQVF